MEKEIEIIMSAAADMNASGTLDDYLRGDPLSGVTHERHEIADKIITYMVHAAWFQIHFDEIVNLPADEIVAFRSSLEQSLHHIAFMMMRNLRSVTTAYWINKMRAYDFDLDKMKNMIINLGTMNAAVARLLPPHIARRMVVYTFCNCIDTITMFSLADRLWNAAPSRKLTLGEFEGIHQIVQAMAHVYS